MEKWYMIVEGKHMKPKELTLEEKLKNDFKRGLTVNQVAEKYGLTDQTVKYYFKKYLLKLL
jgi:DNA-binding NarL/FixJ family response regulator